MSCGRFVFVSLLAPGARHCRPRAVDGSAASVRPRHRLVASKATLLLLLLLELLQLLELLELLLFEHLQAAPAGSVAHSSAPVSS